MGKFHLAQLGLGHFPTWRLSFLNLHKLASKVAQLGDFWFWCLWQFAHAWRQNFTCISIVDLRVSHITRNRKIKITFCQICQVRSAKLKTPSTWRTNLAKFTKLCASTLSVTANEQPHLASGSNSNSILRYSMIWSGSRTNFWATSRGGKPIKQRPQTSWNNTRLQNLHILQGEKTTYRGYHSAMHWHPEPLNKSGWRPNSDLGGWWLNTNSRRDARVYKCIGTDLTGMDAPGKMHFGTSRMHCI